MITPEKPGVAPVGGKWAQTLLAASLAATNFQTPEMTRTIENARKQMLEAMTPSFQNSLASAHRTAAEFYGTPGTSSTPAVYGPDGPPENSVKQLLRFRWIEHVGNNKGLRLTALGKALLKAALLDSGVTDTDVLMLAAQDTLAWGKLLGHISELGDCLIVDPYLKAPELSQIIEHTTAARILVGPGLRNAELIELRVLLGTNSRRDIEIRQAPPRTLHDRYFINDDVVHLIGASMNNIGGTTTTMLVPLPDDPATLIRNASKEWWDVSVPLAPSTNDEGTSSDNAPD